MGLGWAQKLLPAAAVSAIFALVVDLVVVWGWHVPALHEASARNEAVFVVQQVSFILAGILVWTTSFRQESRASIALGIAAMFSTFAHMAMLGILLGMSPTLIYAPDLCIGAFGFSGLEDQQFGGVLMASMGGIPHLAGGLYLTYRLVSGLEQLGLSGPRSSRISPPPGRRNYRA